MIHTRVSELVGGTPMLGIPVRAKNSTLMLKIEKNNPGGSMKDRMARSMITSALRSGRLKRGGVVVESSSGNTGIGLALAVMDFDIRFVAVVDRHAAQDKIEIMRALGGEIRYVEGDYAEDEVAVVARQCLAAELAESIPGAVFMNQSDNPANPAGYAELVREVVAQTDGRIDAFVGCVGTGGSMTGIARGLKEHNEWTVAIAVEPVGSIIFGRPGRPYYQSGTGTPQGDTVGQVLDYRSIDKGVQVTDSQAFETARYVARHTGLLVGGSTGGAIYKALEAIHTGFVSGNVLVVVVDGGEKYLHTIFNEQWLGERGLLDPQVAADLKRWLA
ncbi:PLP-dependent cysteine synthase family protein [Micromonospora sp. HUAS LYJ1]|uniref:PLP-dependent cysteine synthase family protein n=1 Tax=Micromonospora sp. HUAS LYJ1 TaxID=3061626 RepID=UPI0026732E7B|nr:cysteine synthase family protein [Micromonospora sp. HUAS LYJ1]WKU05553.1 cysteine synthase family protein [Micromonospora sp. HUAS LYJ1]